MPQCLKCNNIVSEDEISKSKKIWCKSCYREYHRQYREKNREKLRKYSSERWKRDRELLLAQLKDWRYRNHEERLKKEREWRKNSYDPEKRRKYKEANREQVRETQRKYAKRNKEKIQARYKLNYYLSKGSIKKPERCQLCESEQKLEAHHHDYNKPFDVLWVCEKCHKTVHKVLKIKSIKEK